MFKTVSGGKLPTRGTEFSACVDLYANEDVVIEAGETKTIGLGIKLGEEELYNCANMLQRNYAINCDLDDFKSSHYLQLMLRSSLAKKGLIVPNGVGIIDLDYKDEIKIIIHNPINAFEINRKIINSLGLPAVHSHIESDKKVIIKKGDKIAQTTMLEHKSYLFGIDTETKRTGGFGSTNNKEKL